MTRRSPGPPVPGCETARTMSSAGASTAPLMDTKWLEVYAAAAVCVPPCAGSPVAMCSARACWLLMVAGYGLDGASTAPRREVEKIETAGGGSTEPRMVVSSCRELRYRAAALEGDGGLEGAGVPSQAAASRSFAWISWISWTGESGRNAGGEASACAAAKESQAGCASTSTSETTEADDGERGA